MFHIFKRQDKYRNELPDWSDISKEIEKIKERFEAFSSIAQQSQEEIIKGLELYVDDAYQDFFDLRGKYIKLLNKVFDILDSCSFFTIDLKTAKTIQAELEKAVEEQGYEILSFKAGDPVPENCIIDHYVKTQIFPPDTIVEVLKQGFVRKKDKKIIKPPVIMATPRIEELQMVRKKEKDEESERLNKEQTVSRQVKKIKYKVKQAKEKIKEKVSRLNKFFSSQFLKREVNLSQSDDSKKEMIKESKNGKL